MTTTTNCSLRVITIERGSNIGQAIIDDFKAHSLWGRIKILTTNVQRDCTNKRNVAVVEYTFE